MRRVFLGWDRPGLESVVEHLVAAHRTNHPNGPELHLSDVLIVVPGARAGRRLLERLVLRAEDLGASLTPPRIVTVGRVASELIRRSRPYADDWHRHLAWCAILRRADPGELSHWLGLSASSDSRAYSSVAESIARRHRDLASEGRSFRDAAAHVSRGDYPDDAERFDFLARLADAYLELLDGLGRPDPVEAERRAALAGDVESPRALYLVAVTELPATTRELLDRLRSDVVALIVAPDSLADRFDAHGCTIPAAWCAHHSVVTLDHIVVADRPSDQAREVLRALDRAKGSFSAEEISIGVPDQDILPALTCALERAGAEIHVAIGSPLSASAPCRLLAAAADYVESDSFESFASLVRHPDLQPLLSEVGGRADPLDLLDRIAAERFPEGTAPMADDEQMGALRARIEALVAPLRSPIAGPSAAATAILDVLAAIYDRPDSESSRGTTEDALGCLADLLADLASVATELAGDSSTHETIGAVLDHAAGVTLPQHDSPSAIEVLGWLELALDDAPFLIVTGMNEGRVPSATGADPYLPESLRTALGLADGDRRHARDAWVLSVLLASRPESTFIVGRRTSRSDPLTPSRLLLSCDRADLVERVEHLFVDPPATRALRSPYRAGVERTSFPVPVPGVPTTHSLTSLSVTGFADYLACPFGFYLRRILRLRTRDDAADELGPLEFGSLAHGVLEDFAGSDLVASTDADAIARWLDDALSTRVAATFGRPARAAIEIQREQLRKRLHAFARWQAEHARHGWVVEACELSIDEADAVRVEDGRGRSLLVTGRIDRVDRNTTNDAVLLLDYKTSEAGKGPDAAHRRGGAWIDLQLPLYRHLARVRGYEAVERFHLGYIPLPKDARSTTLELATWTDEELEEADATARSVARGILDGRFERAAGEVPWRFKDFAIIYQNPAWLTEESE